MRCVRCKGTEGLRAIYTGGPVLCPDCRRPKPRICDGCGRVVDRNHGGVAAIVTLARDLGFCYTCASTGSWQPASFHPFK